MRALPGILVLVATLLATPLRAAERPLRVSAAISLAASLETISREFAAATGRAVVVTTASSGKLALQIEAADVADVFVSADADTMRRLVDAGRVDASSVRAIAGNTLVVVGPVGRGGSLGSLEDLAGERVRRIAIGDPATVPAGRAAERALRSAGLSERVAGRLIFAASARQVMDYAIRGEVDAAIVYATDARDAGDAVTTRLAIDPSLHASIVYVAGVVRGGDEVAARAFVDRLLGPDSQHALARSGFTPPPANPTPMDAATDAAADASRSVGTRASLVSALALSLRVAGTASLLAMLVAVPLAWLLSRRRFAGKSVVEALLLLPLVLPPTVIGYALIVLLGRHGLLGGRLEGSLVFRVEGAILAATVVALPLIYLPTRAAFASVDREMEDIARLMGASRMQTFFHVSLPMARRGIASGLMLGFARGLGEFGATVMILGLQPGRLTLPISIYLDYERGTLAMALPAVLLLTAASLAIVALYNRTALGRGD